MKEQIVFQPREEEKIRFQPSLLGQKDVFFPDVELCFQQDSISREQLKELLEIDLHYPGLVVGSEREKKLKRFLEENELPSLLTSDKDVLIIDPQED